MTWVLRLLQEASLDLGGGREIPLERKTAGLLAYLSLQGATRRSRVAGLLWPDSGEARARSNLRQLLSRLRRAAGQIVEGEALLVVSRLATSDLQSAVLALRSGTDPHMPPTQWILPCFDYSDCPDFYDWLSEASRGLVELQCGVLEAEVARSEVIGELDRALDAASRLVALDELSERAHRAIIRVHYLRGDRAAALHAYRRCEDILARDLGTTPMPETRDLLRQMEADAPAPTGRSAARPCPAPVISRPSRLVGRDAAWAMMEDEWEQGKLIYVSGEAGMGKSRLAESFLEEQGRGIPLLLHGRAGDASVPFASQARAIRAALASAKDVQLDPWVRMELSRMLPELVEPGDESLPSLREEDARLRFFQAQVEFIRSIRTGPMTVFIDNLQYFDEESAAIGHYMFSALSGSRNALRAVVTFRPGEMPPVLRRSVDELTKAGIAAHIELAPLSNEALRDLISDIGVDGPLSEGETLYALSGGNPAILIEAIKALPRAEVEPGGTYPQEVYDLLQRRLAMLSDGALNLARVAAAAGDLLTPDLAASVLDVHPLRLCEAWRELEAHLILQGTSLVHDMVKEAILSGIPRPLHLSLHRRTATWLEAEGADPIRIALHREGAAIQERAASGLHIKRYRRP